MTPKNTSKLIAVADRDHTVTINDKTYGPFGRLLGNRRRVEVYEEGLVYRAVSYDERDEIEWETRFPKQTTVVSVEKYKWTYPQ
ncbi:MAG: hypothetical protein A3G20_04080 [Acidobacteria bacterium RIFCSPLOWO2_12_FULL_59_11]|nr:MAG: hypothetical protein A3G20_04080 [Acidobacteria bacterium RIFCSPLOWO2_12_FULL_59_11]